MLEDGEIDEDDIEIPPPVDNNKKLSPPKSISPKNNHEHDDDEDDKRSINSVNSSITKNKRKLKDSNGYNRNNKKLHKFDLNNSDENIIYDDRDDRSSNHNLNSLMSINTNGKGLTTSSVSSWSTPLSKNDLKPSNSSSSSSTSAKPISLFDLVINPVNINVDPIITEKENKLTKNNKLVNKNNVISDDGEPDESEMTVSVESIEKKMLKKKRYAEIMKEKQKKEQEKQLEIKQKQQQTLCHFYAEGRCQKGDKCPFSHSMPIPPSQSNKKLEICKYYLNGFCAKNEKCLYMHSEFPCKFFHRINYQTGQKKPSCAYGDQCRFSHEPITDPSIKEAFEKYLNEQQTNHTDTTPAMLPQQVAQLKKPSLLGSPPISSSNKDSLPSLMDLPIKKSTENPSSPPQSKIPSLLGLNTNLIQNKQSTSEFKDVDERSINLNIKNDLLIKSNDVDERPVISNKTPIQQSSQPNNINNSTNNFIPSIMNNSNLSAEDKYESIKKELIVKIMKAIADEDGGIFSQIPKNTLTELLVKLLNSNSKTTDNSLSSESIIALLATLTAASTSNLNNNNINNNSNSINTNTNKDDDLRNLNESTTSSNLQIDFSSEAINSANKRKIYDEYDDEDEYENCLVIEGNVGEFPYDLIEIDIEPSKLWTNPPLDKTLDLLDSNPDQECDPRIKYYSNKSNVSNVANFQLQMYNQNKLQQQLLENQSIQTPTSPNSQQKISEKNDLLEATKTALNSAATSVLSNSSKPAARIVDPRLASRNATTASLNNLSPTRPSSPNKSEALNNLLMPLNNSKLLSQLPDFQAPKESQQRIQTLSSQPILQQQSNDSNVVKLTIEDYKRKLQKPSNTTFTNSTNKLNDITSNNTLSTTNTITTNSALPSIPSYVVNLQAPQSLHELLKNFQS